MNKRKKVYRAIILQLGVVIFSVAGIITKLMGEYIAKEGIIFHKICVLGGILILIYFIYAIIWQYILSDMPLSIAYMSKATIMIWSLIWSSIIFAQPISIENLCGILMIVIGIYILQEG